MSTATAIIKGALSSVLKFPLGRTTVGVNFPKPGSGRITVTVGDTIPTEAAMADVAAAIKRVVAEDRPCFVFTMSKSEAEDLYGDCMYDKFDVSYRTV